MYRSRRKVSKSDFFKYFDKNYKEEGYSKFSVSDFVRPNYLESFCKNLSLDLIKKEIKFFRKEGIYYVFEKQIPEFHILFEKHLKNYLENSDWLFSKSIILVRQNNKKE